MNSNPHIRISLRVPREVCLENALFENPAAAERQQANVPQIVLM